MHNFERVYEHQCFLDWLLDTIVAEQAEGLLVAGDVFDNANPSAASQKQLYRFLQQAKARAPHLNIVIIAGNHDSPGRLEAPGPLLEERDVSVVGHVRRLESGAIDLEQLVLPLKNRSGEIAAWCLAIPFLGIHAGTAENSAIPNQAQPGACPGRSSCRRSGTCSAHSAGCAARPPAISG